MKGTDARWPLEGIGFLDENTGWVVGWGSAYIAEGFSNSTSDGDTTWQHANGIGEFINRFQFFHDSELVGYASGRTVYRYAAESRSASQQVAPAEAVRRSEYRGDRHPAERVCAVEGRATQTLGTQR